MRNKKVRFILVFVLVISVLSLTCCKRNNRDNSLVSSLVSSNNSNVDPLVTVADPNARKESEVVKSESVSPNVAVTTSQSEDNVQSSTQDTAVVEATVVEESVVTVPSIPTVAVGIQELYVIEDEIENALLSDDVPLIEKTFSYKGIEAEFYVFSTFARITLPFGTTDDDIALCVSLLNSAYPEETQYITYKKVEDSIVLLYPRCGKEYLSNILDIIFVEGRLYIDTLIPTIEESIEDETSYSVSFTLFGDVEAVLRLTSTELVITINRELTSEEFEAIKTEALKAIPELDHYEDKISENGVLFTFDSLEREQLSDLYTRIINLLNASADNVIVLNEHIEESQEEKMEDDASNKAKKEEKNEVEAVVPVTEKGRKLLSFEASVNAGVYYDIEHNILRATADLRFQYDITSKFSLGIKGGYDWGNYILLGGYLNYDVSEKIYIFGGAGYKFDIDSLTDYSSAFVELGVGFEHNMVSSLYIFGEVGARYAFSSYSKLTPLLSLGFKYQFSF